MALLLDDRPDPERWMRRLKELRALEGIRACSEALQLLAHLPLPEDEAETVLSDVLGHRGELTRALGRDPGLRVAAVDFLSNVEHRLSHPKIVEMSEFEKTERSATTDALTGLYNRRFLHETLDREVRRCRRYRLVLSIVMLDLDDFKRVNDVFGHLFGDLVLQKAAGILRRAIREADVACRYGGEEFAVILPETDRLGAHSVASRILQSASSSFSATPTAGRTLSLTFSGGIATYPEDGEEPESLLQRADEGLYRAKRAGKNRISLYHEEKRRWVRYPTSASARVRVESDASQSGRAALPLNMSRHGLLVETTTRFLPAESVRVLLGRDGKGDAAADWVVDGRVVRVEPRQDATDRFRVGIAFEHPVSEECFLGHVVSSRQAALAPRGDDR